MKRFSSYEDINVVLDLAKKSEALVTWQMHRNNDVFTTIILLVLATTNSTTCYAHEKCGGSRPKTWLASPPRNGIVRIVRIVRRLASASSSLKFATTKGARRWTLACLPAARGSYSM